MRSASCIPLPAHFEPLIPVLAGACGAQQTTVREVLENVYRSGFVDGGHAYSEEALRQAAEALGVAPRRTQ